MDAASQEPGDDLGFVMTTCSCSRRKALSALKLHKGDRDAAVKSLQDSASLTSTLRNAPTPAERPFDQPKTTARPGDVLPPTSSTKPPSRKSNGINGAAGKRAPDGNIPPQNPGFLTVPARPKTRRGSLGEKRDSKLAKVPELVLTPPVGPRKQMSPGTPHGESHENADTPFHRGNFRLPVVDLPANEPPFSPDEGRRLPFSLARLVSALGQGLQAPHLHYYLSFYDEETVRRGLSTPISGVPSIFHAVATNDENVVRTWAGYGADVNATEPKSGIPLLAFAILSTLASHQDTTYTVMTLLSLGADASVIPKELYTPCIADPVDKMPLGDGYPEHTNPKTSWCKGAISKQMARTINLSQRYFLEKVSKSQVPSGRQSQVTRVHNATALLGVSHFLIGQSTATSTVSEVLISHLALPRSKPLVMAFTGPSGHGKTELARRMGELLNLEIQCVDCTEMKHETDLFGPKKPYIGHELGSPLNNFLSQNTGKQCIVFLDELEKTTREVQNALLVPFSEGRYSDRRNRQPVNTSQTIWIFATNATDEVILDFFEIHKRELTEAEDPMRRSELMSQLTSSIKKQLKSTFGNPLSGRTSVIVPFLPFSPVEAAVVTHKFVLEFRRRVLQSIQISGKRLVGNIVLDLQGDGAICKLIADEDYDCDQGSRSLQSSVESRIGDSLVRAFLQEERQIDDCLPLAGYGVFLSRSGNIVVRKTGEYAENEEEDQGKQDEDQSKQEEPHTTEESESHTPEVGEGPHGRRSLNGRVRQEGHTPSEERYEHEEQDEVEIPEETGSGQKLQGPEKGKGNHTKPNKLEGPEKLEERTENRDNKSDADDDKFKMMEELLRTTFSDPSFQSLCAKASKDYETTLRQRYPNLYGKFSVADYEKLDFPKEDLADLNTTFEESTNRIREQVNALELLVQLLRKLPLSDQDQQHVDTLDYSTRDIRMSLDYNRDRMARLNNALEFSKDMLFGDDAKELMDLQNKSPEDQAKAITAFHKKMENIYSAMFAEDSAFMKEAHKMKIGGLANLRQNFDVFRNGKIIWDPANLGPGLPDLSAYDTFQYRRLGSQGSIRLLYLKDMPDENPNFIELRVEEIDLNNSPAFIALSYVWGDHRPPLCQAFNRKRAEWKLPILCNGKKALVTYNLFCCLRRLTSSQDEPLRSLRRTAIFIDQLCINQSDKAEKASQVAMMGKIYSYAQAVVSWLGETDPDTNAAVSLVQALNDVPPSRIKDPDFDPSAFVNEFSHDDWLSLGALLSRPYFKRAWIVQEVVLARRLIMVCGDRLLDWDKIALALKLIADSRSLTELSQYVNLFRSEEDQMPVLGMRSPLLFGEQFSTLVAARESARNINTPPINLLLLGRQFDATYTVDKFFAMVGMENRGMKTPESQALLAIDYDQRLKSVALRFTEYYLQSSGSFSFLALVEDATHRTQENKDFPSWLPDPAAPLLPLPLRAKGFQLDGPTTWRPCGDVEALDASRIDGDLFRLRGYNFDGVAKTCVSFDVLDRSNEWSRFFDFISGLSNLQTNGFPVGEALWRTLIASPDRPSGKVASSADLDEEFTDWCIALTKTIRDQYIRKLLHSATPGFKAATHRINETVFDYQTLGESLKSYFGEEDARQEFLQMPNMTHTMRDRDMAESKNGEHRQRDVDQGLEKSLHNAWERHKDGVLPSPERVRRTLEAIHEARQGTPGYKEIFDSAARFEAAVGKKLHSRRLIVTREGRLGLGPESASEGHEIWAVAGASVPIILQKTGRGTFKYVGEAFVFGAMHGEAVRGAGQRLESVVLE